MGGSLRGVSSGLGSFLGVSTVSEVQTGGCPFAAYLDGEGMSHRGVEIGQAVLTYAVMITALVPVNSEKSLV